MEKLNIETPQNVFLQYRIAGVGERILATLIDWGMLGTYAYIILRAVNALLPGANAWVYFILFSPAIFYNLVAEVFFEGQSFGKFVLKLKVIMLDGSQPHFSNYLMRFLFRVIDITLMSGAIAFFTVIINGRGQRLGDIVAGTTVVNLRKKISLGSLWQRALPQGYKPYFESLDLLSDKELQTLERLYLFIQRNPGKRADEYLNAAKKLIESRFKISWQYDSKSLLERVLDDYQFHTANEVNEIKRLLNK